MQREDGTRIVPLNVPMIHTAYLICQKWTGITGQKHTRIGIFSEEHPSMITDAGYSSIYLGKETGSDYQKARDKLRSKVVITPANFVDQAPRTVYLKCRKTSTSIFILMDIHTGDDIILDQENCPIFPESVFKLHERLHIDID